MSMNSNKQTSFDENLKQNDKYNFALYVPEITHKDWEIKDERVLLKFEVKHPLTKFAGFLSKKEPKKDMLFDEMCSAAWLLIDGEKSIFEIARVLSEDSEDEFKEDMRRLVEFIKFASKKGWVRYKEVKSKEDIIL